jgi:hypothetical protein
VGMGGNSRPRFHLAERIDTQQLGPPLSMWVLPHSAMWV